ncbi:unnamed protein product, partial [Mesorhabditis belari]|uniref:IRS-type PTB domain-containing protein n=1 Tax=Mesorhabditis belari TaxID=2138241 RepID=A0AAF3FFW9_9BILA
MGNYVSEHKRPSATVDGDVCEFRVYIHRRNKFIHAWMKLTPREIIVQRSKTDIVVFPLQYLRRYGYTSAGVFFFESGRRCATGEGLHTFQSQHAETIFHMVQARVQDTANAAHADWAEQRRRDVRTQSVDHTPRIHPVQRYLSERNTEFSTFNQPNYNSLHAGEMKRRRQLVTPAAPRPRSLPGIEDTLISTSPQIVQNSHGHAQIIGNIISESPGPNKGSVSSLYNPSLSTIHSYSNVVPRAHYQSATPTEYPFRARCPSASSDHSTISAQSFQSTPSTPTTKVFPIQWDGGAGSTSFLCYANSTPITPSSERSSGSFTPTLNDEKSSLLSTPPTARNPLSAAIVGIGGISLDERPRGSQVHGKNSPSIGSLPRTTHRHLNYATMEAPLAAGERTSRSPSVSGSCVSLPQNATSYAVIDPERTKALKQARDDVARSNLDHLSPSRSRKIGKLLGNQ